MKLNLVKPKWANNYIAFRSGDVFFWGKIIVFHSLKK
jgi:hypothetical protein